MASWEHFHHTADVGVRGIGGTLEEAFAQAALALTAVLIDPDHVTASEQFKVSISAPEPDLLLYEWLNALIFEMATRHMLLCRFDISIAGAELKATVYGELLEAARHQPAVEVKGATFTALAVEKQDNGDWLAQCVVDV